METVTDGGFPATAFPFILVGTAIFSFKKPRWIRLFSEN
jgi:hypothetical protein